MKMLNKQYRFIILMFCVILLSLGSVGDYQISSYLYRQNSVLATFFAAFGEVPGILCTWTGAALMFRSLSNEAGIKKVMLITATVLLMGSSFLGLYEPYQFLTGNLRYAGVAAEMILSVVAFIFVLKKAEITDNKKARKIAAVLLLVSITSSLLINVIKIPWGRPRFRSILANETLEFQPWWKIGTSARDAFEGVLPHEEFKSFPSGHSAGAACSLALTLLCQCIPMRERNVSVIALVWTIIVMLCRIVAGAHFLSDVTIGFAVTYIVLFLLNRVYKIPESD